jgi:hypothetical protein
MPSEPATVRATASPLLKEIDGRKFHPQGTTYHLPAGQCLELDSISGSIGPPPLIQTTLSSQDCEYSFLHTHPTHSHQTRQWCSDQQHRKNTIALGGLYSCPELVNSVLAAGNTKKNILDLGMYVNTGYCLPIALIFFI